MTEHATTFPLITVLVLATILLVFGMKYLTAGRQARLRSAGETAYRELSATAVAAQSASAASLAGLQADVSEMKARLAAVEKVLREVG